MTIKKKKILITGHTGFLGSRLLRELKKKKYKNKIFCINTNNINLLKKKKIYSLKKKFNIIFHLAVDIEVGLLSKKKRKKIFKKNDLINKNIINWWEKYNPEAKFISIGTSASYSDNITKSEEFYLRGKPQRDWTQYAYSKRKMQKRLIKCSKKGLKFLTLVPCSIYGPGYYNNDKKKHFIADIISKILFAKKNKSQPILYGDGLQERDIIFIDDFINIILKLCLKIDNLIINVSNGKSHTIKFYTRFICKLVKFDFKKVIFNKIKSYGVKKSKLEISLLKKKLIKYKFTSFRKGLNETILCIKKEINCNI